MYTYFKFKISSVVLFLTCSLGLFSFQSVKKACPLNLDEARIIDLEKDSKQNQAKVVAFEGVVTEVGVAKRGKPFYKVMVGKAHVWVGGHGDMESIVVGNTYRILGIVCTWVNDKPNKKFNDQSFFILSSGHINMDTKQGSVLPMAKSFFDKWTEGEIPSAADM